MVSEWRCKAARDVPGGLITGPIAGADREITDTPDPSQLKVRLHVAWMNPSAHDASRSPDIGLSKMPLDPWLSGRVERRLPIIVAVRLAPCVPAVSMEKKKPIRITSVRAARACSPNTLGNPGTHYVSLC